ncbi:hypothetical protein [Pantoea piersonii]|uniref:hypothetical protein n=1 Tax=Pantoea piersonii TaxID=2364647 RepID=UPI00289A7AD7|nr:hypothetical protein [Pantoea piersonii]
MNKLTAEKCRDRIARLKECEKMPWGLSIDGIYQLQALEIALPVLEQQESECWIVWEGGECPVAENTPVAVKYRNGVIMPAQPADCYEWNHDGWGGDIIAYRVIEQQERERGEDV